MPVPITLYGLVVHGKPFYEFKRPLEEKAINRQIVLAEQGLRRDSQHELIHAREIRESSDSGFLYGLERESSQFLGVMLRSYVCELNSSTQSHMMETLKINKIGLFSQFRESEFARKIAEDAFENEPDVDVNKLLMSLMGYAVQTQKTELRIAVQALSDGLDTFPQFCKTGTWKQLYSGLGRAVLSHLESEGEYVDRDVHACLSSSDTNLCQNAINKYIGWNQQKLYENARSVIAIAEKEIKPVVILVGHAYGRFFDDQLKSDYAQHSLTTTIRTTPM